MPRIETQRPSRSSPNGVAELDAKSAWAQRSPAALPDVCVFVCVWPARTCAHDLSTAFTGASLCRSALGTARRDGRCAARVHHRQTAARQPGRRRLGWFGKRDARPPLPGTHRWRRTEWRRRARPAFGRARRLRCARPPLTTRGVARCIEPSRLGRLAMERNQWPARGGGFDSVTGWRPRESRSEHAHRHRQGVDPVHGRG